MDDRLIPSLVMLALAVLAIGLMYWGWKNRTRRSLQKISELPEVPSNIAEAKPVTSAPGIYISTTVAGDWLERVSALTLGHRSAVDIRVYDDAVLLHRPASADLYLNLDALELVYTSAGMAGKFMGKDGVLILRWTWQGNRFDTGINLRYKDDQKTIEDTIANLIDSPRK